MSITLSSWSQPSYVCKISVKPTLVETYEEAEKVEAKMESIDKYLAPSKEKTFGNIKSLLLTKPKDERSQELDGVVKMAQKLSNRIIDLKRRRRPISNSNLITKREMTVVHPNLPLIVPQL